MGCYTQSSSRATPSAFTLHAIYIKVLHFLSLSLSHTHTIDSYTHYIITITSLRHFQRYLVNLFLSSMTLLRRACQNPALPSQSAMAPLHLDLESITLRE
jgi:hypothetical protein